MLAPIRHSLPRVSHTLRASRSVVTKAERWTPAMARAIEQSGGSPSLDLKQVLPNIEARWGAMTKEEQFGVYRQLEEIQKKDWRELSIDEKKAAYFVSFGPHGPRKPITQPGQGAKTLVGVSGLVAATLALFYGLRYFAHEKPKTMNVEWQEKTNERLREQNANPITGLSSEGYKGKGHAQGSLVK